MVDMRGHPHPPLNIWALAGLLAIVGDIEDPDLMTRLKEEIRQAGHADRICFTGHREDIADVLAALDLLAAPSRWEGFGLMLAEAMAAGVPVLASDVGDTAPPGDVEACTV